MYGRAWFSVATRVLAAVAVVVLVGVACQPAMSHTGGQRSVRAKGHASAGATSSASPVVPHLEPRRRPARTVAQAPGPHHGTTGKVVALTFDDGPGPATPQVLQVLRRKHVPATFFEVGEHVAANRSASAALAAAGMSVQSHTWDHKSLVHLSPSAVDAEVLRTNQAIAAATGVTPTCLRPPYGAFDTAVGRRLARDGVVPVNWNVDTEDWKRPGVARIVHNAIHPVHPGSVILMHDGGGDRRQTVAALPKVIDELRALGYTFTVLCR